MKTPKSILGPQRLAHPVPTTSQDAFDGQYVDTHPPFLTSISCTFGMINASVSKQLTSSPPVHVEHYDYINPNISILNGGGNRTCAWQIKNLDALSRQLAT